MLLPWVHIIVDDNFYDERKKSTDKFESAFYYTLIF